MIAALMLYSLAVTMLFAIAAVAAEQLLRLSRRPARAVWLVAMLAATGFSAARFRAAFVEPAPMSRIVTTADFSNASANGRTTLGSVRVTTTPGSARTNLAQAIVQRLNPEQIRIAAGSPVTLMDRPLLFTWFALSGAAMLIIGLSTLRLARPRRRWSTTTVDGVPVLVSHDLGPAVIGVLRYRIVMPAWSLELAPAERDLILAHEREHASAGDPSLLFAATVLIALTPWNAPLWWMARRLRFAIELDCDARVLRHRPDRTAYGSLLLDVSERTLGGAMPIAALAETVSLTERRISAMTSRLPRFAVLRGAAAGVIATALVVVACAAPHPAAAPAPSKPESVVRSDATQDTLKFGRELARLDALNAARLDSVNRIVRAQSESLRFYRARTAAAGGGLGGVELAPPTSTPDTNYPRVMLGRGATSGSVTRDSISWSQARARITNDSSQWAEVKARVQANLDQVHGSMLPPGGSVRVGSGASANTPPRGLSWTNPAGSPFDNCRICVYVTDSAFHRFPAARGPHENELDMIVLVFDSTGAVVRAGMKSRPPLMPRETLMDRAVLRAVMPGESIDSFREWGMFQIFSKPETKVSDLLIMYAFTGREPW